MKGSVESNAQIIGIEPLRVEVRLTGANGDEFIKKVRKKEIFETKKNRLMVLLVLISFVFRKMLDLKNIIISLFLIAFCLEVRGNYYNRNLVSFFEFFKKSV